MLRDPSSPGRASLSQCGGLLQREEARTAASAAGGGSRRLLCRLPTGAVGLRPGRVWGPSPPQTLPEAHVTGRERPWRALRGQGPWSVLPRGLPLAAGHGGRARCAAAKAAALPATAPPSPGPRCHRSAADVPLPQGARASWQSLPLARGVGAAQQRHLLELCCMTLRFDCRGRVSHWDGGRTRQAVPVLCLSSQTVSQGGPARIVQRKSRGGRAFPRTCKARTSCRGSEPRHAQSNAQFIPRSIGAWPAARFTPRRVTPLANEASADASASSLSASSTVISAGSTGVPSRSGA